MLLSVGSLSAQYVDVPRNEQTVAEKQLIAAYDGHQYALVVTLGSKALLSMSDRRHRAFLLAYRASAYRHLGQLEKALSDGGEALRLNPKTPFAHAGRAGVHEARGEIDLAIAEYTGEIELNPRYLPAYTNRGHWYRKGGEFNKAIADFHMAVRIDPNDPDAFAELAVIYYVRGEHENALTNLREATARINRSTDERTLALVAWFLATCPDARFRHGKTAVQLARQSCELKEWKHYGSLDALAAAYAECGDFERAVKFEKQALAARSVTKQDRQEIEKHFQLFQERKPYRDQFLAQ